MRTYVSENHDSVYVIQISVLHTIMESISENLVKDFRIFCDNFAHNFVITETLPRKKRTRVYKRLIRSGLIFHEEPRYHSANLNAYIRTRAEPLSLYTFERSF